MLSQIPLGWLLWILSAVPLVLYQVDSVSRIGCRCCPWRLRVYSAGHSLEAGMSCCSVIFSTSFNKHSVITLGHSLVIYVKIFHCLGLRIYCISFLWTSSDDVGVKRRCSACLKHLLKIRKSVDLQKLTIHPPPSTPQFCFWKLLFPICFPTDIPASSHVNLVKTFLNFIFICLCGINLVNGCINRVVIKLDWWGINFWWMSRYGGGLFSSLLMPEKYIDLKNLIKIQFWDKIPFYGKYDLWLHAKFLPEDTLHHGIIDLFAWTMVPPVRRVWLRKRKESFAIPLTEHQNRTVALIIPLQYVWAQMQGWVMVITVISFENHHCSTGFISL